MANKKISDLTLSSGLNDTDIYEVSTTATTSEHTTWSLIKSTLKTYFDSLTTTLTNKTIDADNNTVSNIGTSELTNSGVTNAKLANMVQDTIKGRATASTGAPEDMTATQVRSMINVEDGATADQSNAEIKTAYEANADTNAFTDTDESKLDGIEASADVTDTANVTAAGALMDSEVDADIKTLVLPASTTISTFGATVIDDANAAAAQTTLGVDPAGTDNSVEVIQVACSDLSTALTTGTSKAYFRMPFAMTLTDVRCSLLTAGSTSGTTTVDINESATSVLSTKLTIDNTELTSETAATPAVISDSALADDAIITMDIDAVTGGADEVGLIVTLIGTRV